MHYCYYRASIPPTEDSMIHEVLPPASHNLHGLAFPVVETQNQDGDQFEGAEGLVCQSSRSNNLVGKIVNFDPRVLPDTIPASLLFLRMPATCRRGDI